MEEMTRRQMQEKYAEVLKEMEAHGETGDVDVLLDKLVYMARKGDAEGGDTYYVPAEFDRDAFLADLARLA